MSEEPEGEKGKVFPGRPWTRARPSPRAVPPGLRPAGWGHPGLTPNRARAQRGEGLRARTAGGGAGAGKVGGASAPYNRRRGRARGQRASAQRRRSTQRVPAQPPAPRAPETLRPAPRARVPDPPPARPRAQDRPAPRTPQAARRPRRHGGGGLHQVHQVPALRLQFRLLGEPRLEEGGGQGRPEPGRPHASLGPAEGAQPGRQVAGPPVGAGRGWGSWAGWRGGGGRPGRVAASRISGLLCGRAQGPAAGPGRLGASGLCPPGDGGRRGGCGLGAAGRGVRDHPASRGPRGLGGGAPGAPPP